MSRALPEHPNLDHLRRQAKALRAAARVGDADAVSRIARYLPDAPITLSVAQLVIGREYGFHSWPELKAEVVARTLPTPQRVAALLAASVEGRVEQARRLLTSDPRIAGEDIRTAAVLGDGARVRALIDADPATATTPDTDRGWPPLLYACHSRWHTIDPARTTGIVEVGRLLLDAGADPNTGTGGSPHADSYRSALSGAAGVANNPALAALLLDRGADPDDHRSLRHAVHHPDHACLTLLLAHGARVDGTHALSAAAEAGDVDAVRLLLETGADPGWPLTSPAPAGHLADRSVNPLVAAVHAGVAATTVVELLLAAGADPNPSTWDGVSLPRQAMRRGAIAMAAALVRHGAIDDTSVVDEFLGACRRADSTTARRLLTAHPELSGKLSDEDLMTFVEAAGSDSLDALNLMLDLGFRIDTRTDQGETALHEAAYAGRVDVAALLLRQGAELDARDARFGCTPLCFATVGSGERPTYSPDAEWAATVRLLLDAGAATTGVWIQDKPPSDEVAAVLAGYGITGPNDEDDAPDTDPPDPQVVRELAGRLTRALAGEDLDALAVLLHPRARWGSCTNRGQVLDWYRARHESGVRAQVRDTLIQGDVILLDMVVREPPGTSWPPGPHTLCQAFQVVEGAIGEIRGYPTVADAMAAL